MRRALGFTLWELVCTLGIAGVTLGAGVPAFRTFLLDARLTADVNAWVLAVQLARSEAFKRGRSVVLCKTDDTLRCGDGVAADAGWMVYANLDDAGAFFFGKRRALAGRPARDEKVNALVDLTPREPPDAALVERAPGRERRDDRRADSGKWCAHESCSSGATAQAHPGS